MLCENCGERKAEIHFVKVINGVRVEEDICRKCAEQLMPFHEAAKALKMFFSLEGMMGTDETLKNLLFPMLSNLYKGEGKEIKCPHCGMDIDLDELFDQPGLGEGRDIVFDFSQAESEAGAEGGLREGIKDARVQQAAPDLKVKQPNSAEKEIAELKKELEFVLRGERYERAAEIRDRIIELEKIIKEKSKGA